MASHSSSSDEVDEADLPSAIECDRRCKEFAAITCTDAALAMFYLQDRGWSVELAVHDYFDLSGDMERVPIPPTNSHPSASDSSKTSGTTFEDAEPNRVRVLSWNIDGLDQNNISTRAKSVCQTISGEKPDIVFLQEVVNKNLAVIREACSNYRCVLGLNSGEKQPIDGEYYVAMLLRNDTVKYIQHEIVPFFTSTMSRTILQVKANVKGIPCTLITSHLESTASHFSERQRQLKIAFELMTKCPPDQTVIFGGDLNLRDKELIAVGGMPSGIVDIWQSTGSRPEATYTWDTKLNDNLEFADNFRKPRCRFDRFYYRSSGRLDPVYFELVGLQRIDSCRRFPSDHWGIMAHFNKK